MSEFSFSNFAVEIAITIILVIITLIVGYFVVKKIYDEKKTQDDRIENTEYKLYLQSNINSNNNTTLTNYGSNIGYLQNSNLVMNSNIAYLQSSNLVMNSNIANLQNTNLVFSSNLSLISSNFGSYSNLTNSNFTSIRGNITDFTSQFQYVNNTFSNMQGSNVFEFKAPLKLSGGIDSTTANGFQIKGPANGTVIYNGMAIGINGGLKIGSSASSAAPSGQLLIQNDDSTTSIFNVSSDNFIRGVNNNINASRSIILDAPTTQIRGNIQICDISGNNCSNVATK